MRGGSDEARGGVAAGRYRRGAGGDPGLRAGGRGNRLSRAGCARSRARRQCREPSGVDAGPRPFERSLSRPVRAVRVSRRRHEDRGFLDAGVDPAAAPDGAGREAGGLSRRIVRRPVPARDRGRVERGRVCRSQREFPQSRPPLRGAGRGHAGAVGRAACRVQGALAHDRRCRHQPAPGIGKGAAVVWRARRGDAAPRRQIWRRLDAARLRTRRRGARRLRPAAPYGRGGRARPGDDRFGHARFRRRRRGEMARATCGSGNPAASRI